jgi:hypothetical protein
MVIHSDVFRRNCSRTALAEDGISSYRNPSELKLVCDLMYIIQCTKVSLNKQRSRLSVQWEPSCSMRSDGQTEMTNLISAFRNFAIQPTNELTYNVARWPSPTTEIQQYGFRQWSGSSAFHTSIMPWCLRTTGSIATRILR